MGGISAMSSIDRLLEKHGDELKEELMQQVPESIREHVKAVTLVNEIYHIESGWVMADGGVLPGPQTDIDELADRFPDCEVAY